MNSTTYAPTLNQARNSAESLADTAAAQADSAIDSTRRMANDALDTLTDKVDDVRKAAPGVLSRAAAHVDEITRRSIERAQGARDQVKEKVISAGEVGRGYIRDEPMKSVVIAAATGAAVAALVGYLCRDRGSKA
jgi:ElaB/YqjD/DUF883 family membrane-anchored ribosome-binding protein